MVSNIADTAGAALIAPTYHITIKVLEGNNLFARICAIDDGQTPLSVRPRRPASTAVSDFMHEHFTWDTDPNRGYNLRPRMRSEFQIANDMEIDEGAREIRNLAGQKGERVPGKKEAHAMGWLVRSARTAVRDIRLADSYNVHKETQFTIISTAEAGRFSARIYVDGNKKVVATGTGETHYKAVEDLRR